MRAFAEVSDFVQQVVAQLPWGHNVRLLDESGALAKLVQNCVSQIGSLSGQNARNARIWQMRPSGTWG